MRSSAVWLLLLPAAVFILYFFAVQAEGQARVLPDYPQIDLESALGQSWAARRLTAEEYDLILHQTGLGTPAVDHLLKEADGWDTLRAQQKIFFSEEKYRCLHEDSLCCREQTVDEDGEVICANPLVAVENGDILLTKSSHILGSGWRNGHAALVVDAEAGKTLEAIAVGEVSGIRSFQKWEKYPNFLVLRVKDMDQEQRSKTAEWARTHLCTIPYRLTAGFAGEKDSTEGTQCAHLIWLAYAHFNCDLDSNGGRLVTPRQLARSRKLEIVQVCGMDPDDPW